MPTSSATRRAPARSMATPTGRPSASSSTLTKPVRTSTSSPEGRPSENGTNITLYPLRGVRLHDPCWPMKAPCLCRSAKIVPSRREDRARPNLSLATGGAARGRREGRRARGNPSAKNRKKSKVLWPQPKFFLIGQESQQPQGPCRARHQAHNPTPHCRANSATRQ